jgi:hypothetical protein
VVHTIPRLHSEIRAFVREPAAQRIRVRYQ